MNHQDRNQRGRGSYRDDGPSFHFKKGWITDKLDREGISFAEEVGKFLAEKGLTTSQMRNYFGEVKRIQMNGFLSTESQTAFLLLEPKLAYSVQREANKYSRRDFQKFQKIMSEAHRAVEENNEKQFQNFVNLLEAILAYHKSFSKR
jgi:CRISPR-associated protein Csm2